MAYPVARFIVPRICGLWVRDVKGISNVPKDKPFIIAANHASYFDSLLMHCIIIPRINKKIHALSNSIYWKNWFTRMILEWGGSIPVFLGKNEDAKEKNKAAFEEAIELIRKGDIVEIFPEGKRSRDGKLQKAYNGVARLALKSNAPVLPCGIIGSHEVLPKGKVFPRFARCEVRIGNVMHFEKYTRHGKNKVTDKVLGEIARDVMKQIAKLTGQDYNF